MDYCVRAGTVDDAAGIAAVHVASWQSAYRGLLPDDVLDNLSTSARQRSWTSLLADPRPRSATLVVDRNRETIGFACVGPGRREPAEDEDGDGDGDGELYAIYLHPDQWRHGIGSRLHQAALTCLRDNGFSTATLWVLTGNDRAINFYLQAGWRDEGVRRTDTGPGGVELPEVQLRRDLEANSNASRST